MLIEDFATEMELFSNIAPTFCLLEFPDYLLVDSKSIVVAGILFERGDEVFGSDPWPNLMDCPTL